MDQFGTVNLRWSVGYNGSPIFFIKNDVIAHLTGNSVRFLNLTSGEETFITSPGDGIDIFAVNTTYNVIAFSEACINTKIFIYDLDNSWEPKAVLQGAGTLGVSAIAFANNGSLIATYAQAPDCALTLWNWPEEQKLCSVSCKNVTCTQLSFNPLNWKQICGTSEHGVVLWTTEEVNQSYHISMQKVILPPIDGGFETDLFDDLDRQISRSVSPITSNIRITKTAIAGIVTEDVENIEIGDKQKRCSPKGHCWAQNGTIYCCCAGGQILSINFDSNNAFILYNPVICDGALDGILMENQPDERLEHALSELSAGSMDCVALHRRGLFMAGQDNFLRCISVGKDGDFEIAERIPLQHSISAMCWSPGYDYLALGSTEGSISLYDAGHGEGLKVLCEGESGRVIGLDCIKDNESHCVTCKADGMLQVWSIAKPECIGKINLKCKATTVKCLPSSSSAVVGTSDGRVLVVDLSLVDKPRFVMENSFHKGPVTALGVDNTGMILATGSTDERVFFMNATITSDLKVIGYTKIEGEARKISCLQYVDDNSMNCCKILIGVGHAEDAPCFNRMVGVDLTADCLKGRKDMFVDKTGLFRDSAIMKRSYLFRSSLYDIHASSRQSAFAIQIHGRRLIKVPIPVSENSPANVVLDQSTDAQGHGLDGGCIALSNHFKWLATGAPDGNLILRATGALDNLVTVKAGHRRLNGITHVCFSNDSRCTLTVGGDGTLSCWQWEYSALGKSRATAAVDAARSSIASLRDIRRKQDECLKQLPEIETNDEGLIMLDTSPKEAKTWLDFSIAKAHDEEDQKYKESKGNLRNDIESLRKQVLEMINVNANLPDIEKLGRHEFNMDLEERTKLLLIREEKLKELRGEIEYKNLAKEYIRDLIKRQCWDEMSTKGRSLKAFNSATEVMNYPMRERTKAELEKLEFVSTQRKLEIMEEKARKDALDTQAAVNPSLVEEHNLDDEDLPEDDRNSKETPAVTGSQSSEYNGDNELLHSQFTLCTSQEKRHQIILLEDCIYRMKMAFNKKFDEVYQSKEVEIKRIMDKNTRIKKIIRDLRIGDAVFEPAWTLDEKPEMLLEVNDEEITVEKYISEEEQKKLDALALEAEERKKAEKADNARERALGMMMAGRLEANLEEELKKELVKPEFMQKPLSEWTEEEQKAAKEFEKKEQKLKEEREKFRKTLEAELKKLQGGVTEGTSSFDERLSQLFNQKVKTEMVICQEELKIERLVASLLMEEELDTREAQLLRGLEEKKALKQESSNMVGDVKRELDGSRDSYEIIVAEDKTLDKNFRREFSDHDQHTVDVLYRLFKRRPRAQKTLKAAVETQADVPQSAGGNPFQQRPSSSRAASVAVATLEKAMTELDDDQHMPEGIDHDTWRKLISLRRQKVEKEQQVKSKALILADMNAIYQKRIDEDERLKMEIEYIFKELQGLRDDRLKFNLNLEVQLLLKQGQVELPTPSFINDYTDSILIHRSVVEDLNATIKTLGESKLASMKDSKEFRKGIYQLEWEHKKMYMQAEDLQTAARDIQLLRVTKDLQAFLGEGDHSARQQQEVVTLERTVELHQKMHQRNVKDRMNSLKSLKRLIRKKEEENSKLDDSLEEISLSVAERRNIDRTNDDERNETAAEKRMQDIITRRKLVDLAKAQAQEIAVLRAEVERLRMRTFPALVQVDQR